MPGDTGFVATAKEKKLVADDGKVFCYFVPTIIVQKDNPKGINGLEDLTKPGLRLALADEKAAIGTLQEKVFKKNNMDREALKNVVGAVPAAVLTCSKNPKAAAAFVDYLVSDKGKKVLTAKYFTVEPPK